ncbi:signal peptidase I [Bacillus sp. JJ864]|uniref:signal peptidase I n=1 Tax=Bacillus TaxID=1386 RepID=UPI002741D005|nr:signal peptidase I [Bacillus sp. WLY-B-L8]MDP7977984.1 signal peptidase I [Bacillus sp. WLY-B-L8]HDX9587672.1 signal peptidase I [Bacillus pseudomycoides]
MTKQKSTLWEWTKAILIAVVLAWIIRQFFFAPILVDGVSMSPTLHDRDRMIVNKIGYHIGEPKRFDIIVFQATEDKDYIKRIIGLPGDQIEYRNDTLYINGKPYEEPYLDKQKKQLADGPLTYDFKLEEITGKTTVPKGELFVLGDNRRFSKDSRTIGTISIDQVIGKANILYWPFEDARIVK